MDITELSREIFESKGKAKGFVESLYDGEVDFRFTPRSDSSAFSRCFGVYCYNFLGIQRELEPRGTQIGAAICRDIANYKVLRQACCKEILLDKHYLQLLSFSLSALSVICPAMLDDLDVSELIGSIADLEMASSIAIREPGTPQYGNINMAHGVLFIWLVESGRIKDRSALDSWVRHHLDEMNRFGFWGNPNKPTYGQFQNGYHQYEIFDYLGTSVPKGVKAAEMVSSLADRLGGFSPYSGGGGCYDYDAVHMLTRLSAPEIEKHKPLLFKVARYLIKRQNLDGGFCESHNIRPINARHLKRAIEHIFSKSPDRYSRMRFFLTMLRPAHDLFHTHFSTYQREWDESNLWDTWFRLMALDRIEMALAPNQDPKGGYIAFPGIGFDHSAR